MLMVGNHGEDWLAVEHQGLDCQGPVVAAEGDFRLWAMKKHGRIDMSPSDERVLLYVRQV